MGDRGGGSVGRRRDEWRGKDAGKVTLTATPTFIPQFTSSVNGLYSESIQAEETGRYEAAGGSKRKHGIRSRKGIYNDT